MTIMTIWATAVMLCFSAVSVKADEGKTFSDQVFTRQREHMVATQIEVRGVKDKNVLAALLKVERHKFVPSTVRSHAYDDRPLTIGEGQTISQPYIVALMTGVLKLDRSSKVLEIGTGSGYQAAVLAELCDSVFTIEINELLGRRAENLLANLGYSRVKVRIADGYKGWKEHAPFDRIIVTCAPSQVPQPLVDQLKEGGLMVVPVGRSDMQELVLLKKEKGAMKQDAIVPVRFVPMIDSAGKTY
jgi:protein-L-isoaspartate(D-aspartate) O-methyltransferase